MCASLILRDTEATSASSTKNTAQGIFYKKQVLQRDDVCPHSLNIFCSLFIRHKLVLKEKKFLFLLYFGFLRLTPQ